MTGLHTHPIPTLLAGVVAGALWAAGPAAAQAGDTQTREGRTATDVTLTEIVVTARKRAESLIEVPVAITALDAEGLSQRGILGFNDLNDFVPGLRYQNSAANRNDRSFHTFTMRGMYPGDSPNRQAVTVFVDGVAIPAGAIPGLSNVERVEVVKGPQSAYFGRSTFAGAINFITRRPSLTDVSGKIEASYANHNRRTVDVSLEGPLVENVLSARLTGYYYGNDGYYDNVGFPGDTGERETRAVSASINFEPTSDLSVRLYGVYWRDSDGPSSQALLAEYAYNCNPGGTGRAVDGLNYVCGGIGSTPEEFISQNTVLGGLADFGLITDNGVLKDGFIDHHGLEREAFQLNMQFDYDMGGYTLSGSAGHNENDWAVLTGTYNRPDPSFFRAVHLPYNIVNNSAELRLAAPSQWPVEVLVGSNYYYEDIHFGARSYSNGVAFNLGSKTHFKAETVGVFGSVSYDIGRYVTITGEGRYQWDTIHHFNEAGSDQKDTFTSFSPRVIAQLHVSDNAGLYASYARGTRPGSFNSVFDSLSDFAKAQILADLDVPVSVPEETLRSYEAGVKGEFLDGRLRLLAAAYYAEWRDRQTNQNVDYLPTPTSTTVQSVTVTLAKGETDLWGLELEGAYVVNDLLTLEGTFNWAHTDIGFVNCAECVAITGNSNPVGNSMERYPEFSGTASATFEKPVATNWRGFARVDYIYTGKQYATAANVAYIEPAHRVNLRLGLHHDAYLIEVFARNIFDDDTPTNIIRSTNRNTAPGLGLNTLILAPPEPAIFGLKAGYRF